MNRWSALLLLGGTAACTEPPATRIDGATPQTFAATTVAARGELPIRDRLTFDAAIATVPARRYANDDPAAAARIAFDGMTAAEVVATENDRTRGEN